MKEDERTWETSCYTVRNSHVTVLSLQPCAGSTDQRPFIIWSTLLCKHTSGPFNLWCRNTRVYPHKLWDWGMELGSGFISAPPYPCALLCSLPRPPPEPGWPDQYLLCSALNIRLWSCAALQYQASASSINLFFIQLATTLWWQRALSAPCDPRSHVVGGDSLPAGSSRKLVVGEGQDEVRDLSEG